MTAELESMLNLEAVHAKIDMLVANGDLRGALTLSDREAAKRQDGALHNCSVQLRIRAAKAMAQSRPRADWPPPLPDPFPDCHGIPEIKAAALSGRVLGGAILHHGSLLVRGLLARDEALNMACDVDQVFQSQGAWAADNSKTDGWFSPVDIPSPLLAESRPWQHGAGGIMVADSPAMLRSVVDLYTGSHVMDAIADYFGEMPVVSVGKTMARRAIPFREGEFHQDGAFLGDDVRTVNAWIALSDCGVDAPGLEIVDRRLREIVPTGLGDARYHWSVGRAVAAAVNGGKSFARPVFAAGDALLFDQLMLHATSFSESMDKVRWALECWFFAPSSYCEEQVPIAL
jgi:hypothetical protein